MVLSVPPSANISLLREMLRTSLMGIQQFLTVDRVIVAKMMPKGDITVIEEVRNADRKMFDNEVEIMTMIDADLAKPVQRLFLLHLYGRWLLAAISWLVLAPWAIWRLWDDLKLMAEYFTWASIRYSLMFNLIPVYCLFFCVGITVSALFYHVFYLLKGISPREQIRLENQVKKIRAAGPKHLLWKGVFK